MPKLPPAGKKPICGNFYHKRMGTENITVWAVCEDEWESNGPIVVFASEALANEHCTTLNAKGGTSYDVRALPLLAAAPREVTWYHRQASVRMDGTVRRYEQEPRAGWHYEHDDPELLICEPRDSVVVNAYATSVGVAQAACEAATEAELAKRRRSAPQA